MLTSKPPTLAEVSKTSKRNRTFVGKPRPIRSGVSLVKVPPVALRSHVLLDDQIELVREIQDDLQHAMETLSTCKSENEAMYWKDKVDELRARSEDMVLILKVVSKLSRELVYAKLELEQVTKNGGDILEVRKRVVWLEDRMEALLSRYREDDSARSSTLSYTGSKEAISLTSASSHHHLPKPVEHSPHAGGEPGVKVHEAHGVSRQSYTDQSAEIQGVGNYSEEDDEEEQENSEDNSSTYSSEEDGESEQQNKSTEGVFLTEGSNSEGGSAHVRRITFSPDVSIGRYNEADEGDTDDEQDAVTKYWENPHHKFEFSDQREVITRENPLSYHNLGLAVQSSFIERAPATPSDLPWRPIKKASDMGDAQLLVRETNRLDSESQKFKIALDKLSERIHDIWGKMEDAAMMSIEINTAPSTTANQRPQSRLSATSPIFQQLQLESRKGSRSGTKASKTMSASGSRSPSKSVSIPPVAADNLPPVEASRHTSVVPMMTYYPPAIPKPEVLPIPRTNSDKRYPRISNDWNDTVPEYMPSTIRLVNQMNIANETKITLYKKKDKVKKLAVKKQTSGRRWKIARNPIQTAAQVAAIVSNRKSISTTRLEKDSLQWMRIQEILHKLVSERVQERRDAAMHLGVLDCSDEGIIAGLTKAIVDDKDEKVKYNATKAMVSLGQWSLPAMTIIVRCILDGPYDMQKDLVKTLIHARNVHLVNKTNALGKQLIDKLKQLCASKSDKGDLGFECAICLGCMGVRAPVAKIKLMSCLQSTDNNLVCKSLEVLIRQMRATEPTVIHMVLHQFENSALWKHRAAAAKLLVLIGAHHLLLLEDPDTVFKKLERRLFDDPSKEVRQEVAVTLTSLGMKERVVGLVERRLEDDDDDTRAHAVTAVGVLGMRTDRTIRQLLEMLELDSCEYVRLQVIRTFATLGSLNIKIMRSLRERERQEGPLAREATKALKTLNGRKTAMGHKSPVLK